MIIDSKDNTELFQRYKNGEKELKNSLVNNNLALVKSIAKRFIGRGVPYEDLVGTGTVGLLKAIDGFDMSLGFSFSTYAFSFISGEIKRYLRDDGIIKVSRKVKKNAAIVMQAKEIYFAKHGTEPQLSVLSRLCNLTPEEITECIEALVPVRSISEPVTYDSDLTIGDTVVQEDVFSPLLDRICLSQALGELNEFDRQLIVLRYYRNLTQMQAAKILGVSQVTVSRCEKRILETLKTYFFFSEKEEVSKRKS